MKRKKEIHVLYIITQLDLGGAQKVCLSLVNGLRINGIPAKLISGTGGQLTPNVSAIPDIYLLKEFRHSVSPLGFLTDLHCFIHLISIMRKLKKQYPNLIVHTHSTKAGIMGRWAAIFAGIKTRIHTVHGYAFHNNQNKFVTFCIYLVELFTSFITTHFICVSSKDVKKGISCFPFFCKKHSIIRAAIDWKQFYQPSYKGNPFPQKTASFVFGTISCFKKQKNLFDLLKAFEYVHKKNQNTRLELIGDGRLRSVLEKWIKEHNIDNVVTLHGWQHNVLSIIKQWHCFVLSSLWEGLPCAIIEARLQRLPVISYNTDGIPEVIMNGENGLLYQQKDWPGLAQGMLTISQDQKLYTKLKSYNDNLHDFNDQNMVQQHIDLYKELV